MNKEVKINGAFSLAKLQVMDNSEVKDFIRMDVNRIMDKHIKAHEKDEEPHYYNKNDSYDISAKYEILDTYYNNRGAIKAKLTYDYTNKSILLSFTKK